MSLADQRLYKRFYKQFVWQQKELQGIYGVKTTHKKYGAAYYFDVVAHNLACVALWEMGRGEKVKQIKKDSLIKR